MTQPDRDELAHRMLGMVGELPFAPPPPSASFPDGIVPRPRSVVVGQPVTIDGATVDGPDGPARLVREGLWRAGVPAGSYPVVLRLDHDEAPDAPESYRLEATAAAMTVVAAELDGLARGAATARQLIHPDHVLTATVVDEPVVPLRLLAGWGLYRDHDLEWALELAVEGKFNRVLYNWWGATPEERLTDRDAELVTTARSIGIELVCELRRQALGPAFDVDAVLRHYDDAVDHGFTSFGFCFDDTDFDPFETEFGLLERIVGRLTERLGFEPEFFFCPRFYWFPGQMDYSWLAALAGPGAMGGMLAQAEPRTADEAAERQRDYLRQLGQRLPPRTVLYLANWWSGTPDDWAASLEEGWTSLTGRAPVFWDNQQQNDFRAAAVYPVPMHQRPASFAHALAGYCLNTGRPLSAFGPTSVTAGAWAWNPDGYDASILHGEAIARLYGDAAPAVSDAMRMLEDVMNLLLQPRIGPEQHYGRLEHADRHEVEQRLDDMGKSLSEARRLLSPRAHPLCRHALAAFEEEVHRLHLDLDVAEGDVGAAEAVATILHGRLPRTPIGQSVSWRLHFGAGPMRQLRSLQRRVDKHEQARGMNRS